MAVDSDESSASHSHSNSHSETSTSDDASPMKKAMSPKPSPSLGTPSSARQDEKFNNLFARAGLEGEDESSQPSGASTSVSSESNGRSPSQRPSSAGSSGFYGSDSEARTALSPMSSANRSADHDNSSGSASQSDNRSVPASHGSSWHGSNSGSRRSTGTNSDTGTPSQESSRTHSGHSSHSRSRQSTRESASSASPASNDSQSKRNHDSDTRSASRQEVSLPSSRSDMRSATSSSPHKGSTGRTTEKEESGLHSLSNGDDNSRSTYSRSKSRGDMSTEQQAIQSDPINNPSDRTSMEAQTPQPQGTEASSDTSPKTSPGAGLHPPTQSNPIESEVETDESGGVAPGEAINSDPNEASMLKSPIESTKEDYPTPIEETAMDDGRKPSATSDPKVQGYATNLTLSAPSDHPPENNVDDSNQSSTQNIKTPATRPSILQRLEERRRALQAQSNATKEGSNVVSESKPMKSKANDSSPKADETPGRATAQVENDPKKPTVETLPKPIVDDPGSKVDSQSDYDPRRDDTEKWKDLVRRSAQGSSEQRSSGIYRRGKSDSMGEKANMSGGEKNGSGTDLPGQAETLMAQQKSDTNDIDIPSTQQNQSEQKVVNETSGNQGWMPPALTTYGEKKYSPEPCVEENLDPPMKDANEVSKNIPSQRLSSGVGLPPKAFTPPVSEIEVRPPPEDDSSLGSMGFLFPKLAPATPKKSSIPLETLAAVTAEPVPTDPKRDPTLVTHKLKPTVGGVDYDYYKTWILPGAQPPMPKQQTNHEIDREDPPGTTTVFKPKGMVVESIPVSPSVANVSQIGPKRGQPTAPTQPPKPPSESWAPSRLTHPVVQSRPTDEWDAWREALDAATRDKLPDSLTKRSMRSDLSSTSDWAPPSRPDGWNLKHRSSSGDDAKNTGRLWSTWIPPAQASRIDFAGSITSQPTTKIQERKVYKEPVQPNPFEETKELSSNSSRNSRFDEGSRSSQSSASTSVSESHAGSDESATSTSCDSMSESRNPPSTHTGSVDEEHIVSPVLEAVPAEISSRPTSHKDDEAETTSPVLAPKATDSKRRFSPISVCLLATLLIVVLGGIVGIVVLVLRGKLSDEAPAPAFSPTAPSSTPAPVASPGELTDLIVASSPTTAISFEDPASAQSLALAWLSANQFLGTYSDEQKIQRFILAVIFYSTTGESWNDKDLWVSDIDECDWYSAEMVNEVCNSEHVIDEIDLKANGLSGEVPWTELVMLSPQLLILDLKENRLSGPIADDVGDMTSLLVFDVQNNQFTGTVPSTFGQLTDARQLNLSLNRLSGSIPSEIASMSSLQALWLNNNLLTGTIPSELGQLSNIRSIYLSGNDFVGSMPEEICALGLENLEVNCDVDCTCCTAACGEGSTGSPVAGGGDNATDDNPAGDDLGDDELEGDPIYELIVSRYPGGAEALAIAASPQRAAFRWLQSPTNAQISSDDQLLQRYALAALFYATEGSQWKSTVSWLSEEDECLWYTASDAGVLCDSNGRLTEINLESNNLQGTLPMEIGLLADSLEILDLSGNNMTGSIPITIEGMGLLKEIDLSMNKLFGIVPSELGAMSNLQRIVLSDNNLFSTIPTELGSLSQLEYLDLGSNQLTGTIPDSLGSLQSLAGLALYKNFLSGTLPVSLSNLSNLQLLYLDENDVSGPIPSFLCQMTLEEFWSDCRETQCNCCTTCCSDGAGCA